MTDKDKLDAPYMPSALLADIRKRKDGHWSWSNKKALDKIYERDRFIRAESAQKAREEAANRFCSSCPGKDDGMCAECLDRAIILSDKE